MERIEAKGKNKKQDEIIRTFRKKAIDLKMDYSNALILLMSKFTNGMDK